jgi:hypothetical protein
MQSQRYDNVLFEFLSGADKPIASRGMVIIRESEMVLEIECPGDRPYLIKGKQKQDYYSGEHEGSPDDVSVEAKWTRLDDIFIGTWIEEGIDYLFKFRLPKK